MQAMDEAEARRDLWIIRDAELHYKDKRAIALLSTSEDLDALLG